MRTHWCIAWGAALVLAGCGPEPYETLKPPVDNAQSNAQVAEGTIGSLQFVTAMGEPFDLAQFRGQKNVVLVVTRGHLGTVPAKLKGKLLYNDICMYCASQTSVLLNNHNEFKNRNAEVVVVFPVLASADSKQLTMFQEAIQNQGLNEPLPPLALLLDVELKAVDRLGIRENLAKPATYIVDKEGQTRFAYVGRTMADRPSLQSVLSQLDTINGKAP